MATSKRLSLPLTVIVGAIAAVMVFAGPANADDEYPTSAGTQVLGASQNAPVPVAAPVPAQVAGASAEAEAGVLAFTGDNAVGIGALGGLLLVGGGLMVFAGRRRKSDA